MSKTNSATGDKKATKQDKKKMTKSFYLDQKAAEILAKEQEKAIETEGTKLPASKVLDRIIKEHEANYLKTMEADAEKPTIIAVVNNKGGVGKTTTCASLAACLGQNGSKVLLVDFDGQANLSLSFDVLDPVKEEECILDVLFKTTYSMNNELTLDDIIVETQYENVFIAPSNMRFTDADDLFRSERSNADSLLKYCIQDMEQKFDYIIIDCGPRIDSTITNAVVALEAGNQNSMVIIPVKIDGYSIMGISKTINAVNAIAKGRRKKSPNWMVLKTVVEPNTTAYKEGILRLDEKIPADHYFQTSISKGTRGPESTLFNVPLIAYDPTSKPALEYRALVAEIEAMNE